MNKKALPALFLKNMRNLFDEFSLGNEYERFIQSFQEEPRRGIRMNLLKLRSRDEAETILKQMIAESAAGQTDHPDSEVDATLIRIPWSDDGYYISGEFFPGRHPFYLAGLFYVQEPSAMLPANVLDARPGEHILDLCAAPGGKTVKIAADMKGEGLLIANDINETRVKALVRNVELAGCPNCIVLNESPAHIAQKLPGYFDKILLDAPCSGEGMFRRDPGAMDSWEQFGNQTCAEMQREILTHADRLLKPGGILIYSTCTFSPIENEEMIDWFSKRHPGYEVLPIRKSDGIHTGLSHEESIRNTVHIFPHRSMGEGHFCAKLQKKSLPDGIDNHANHEIPMKRDQEVRKACDSNPACTHRKKKENTNRNTCNERISSRCSKINDSMEFSKTDFTDAFKLFTKDVLTTECENKIARNLAIHFQMIQGHAYTLPEEIPSMDDLKISKKGLYLGELKEARNIIRFEPSHSFILSLKPDDLLAPLSFQADDPILSKYLKGETLVLHPDCHEQPADSPLCREPGRYIPICVQGYPIGWGKTMPGGMIKNLYPQGWRR